LQHELNAPPLNRVPPLLLVHLHLHHRHLAIPMDHG
jgi:hypothetical protein